MTDYIIIGAGSAGCALANRLSANPDINVVLLEAGPESNHLLYRMPAGFFPIMKNGQGNWNYETVPQPGLNGRAMYVPRGKVVGGSSMINGLVHVRGNPGDFDHWAEQGNKGWSYSDCLPYFRRMETFDGGASDFHGTTGPMKISAGPALEMMTPIARACVEAGMQAGYPYNTDYNGASQLGFCPASSIVGDAVRQSAYECYLKPIRARPNLTLVSRAQVTRILFSGNRASGVEYVRKGRLHTVTASTEVILSAGAIHSPQVLQLSGIGDARLLGKYGVQVHHDLVGVGENLHDHLAVTVQQEITKPYSALAYVQPFKAATSLLQYALFKTGSAITNGLEAMAFVKSRADLEYPDIQYHLPLLMYEDHGRQVIQAEGFMFHITACQPQSRGSVRIRSANPTDAPEIDPHYLQTSEDVRVLREGIRIARNVIAQATFDDLRGSERKPGKACTSDEQLDEYIRTTAISVYHHVGTCRMGNDASSVVDEQLRVHGVQGLRVVDASVMPRITTGNTNAATIMIAEKAADMIVGARAAVGVVA